MASAKRGTTPLQLIDPTVEDLLNRCDLALKKCDEQEALGQGDPECRSDADHLPRAGRGWL